ncbi:Spo0B domain-containing protein [Paenibacillus sp. sgz500958]|uniref:Spo0B domain-containing protein n=1 Tax=Paenibacillus sp. sgz500958 TaxID=3242475 RepID=UPI0036D2E89F
MKSWKGVIWAVLLSVAFPLGLICWQTSLWTCLLLALWVMAVVVFSNIWNQRHYERELNLQERGLQRAAIRTLNHHRHDWMNDLQVLYGYIQLGKPDKTLQTVERIKGRIALDSRIAKLGAPSLVFYIQSFRTHSNSLELDVQVEEGLSLENRLTPEAEEELTSIIMQTVRAYQYSGRSSLGEASKLCLDFTVDEGDILITFRAEGTHGNPELFQGQINNIVLGKNVRAEPLTRDLTHVKLRLPLGM